MWGSKATTRSRLKHGKVAEALLVTRHHPATLGDEFVGLLVDRLLGGGNVVLYTSTIVSKRAGIHSFSTSSFSLLLLLLPVVDAAGLRTTVSSSNGLASSMFFSVAARSLSSRSTACLVASAFLTASTSKASMALIWRLTS